MGCEVNNGAPYGARALLLRLDECANETAAIAKLAAAFLICPGAKVLREDDIAQLNAIAGPPPPLSKPKPKP